MSTATAAAGADDYRPEILEHVIWPCLLHLARQQPVEGASPEAMAEAVGILRARELAHLIDNINRQLDSNPPAVARRQIYRVALRSCIRQGAASMRR